MAKIHMLDPSTINKIAAGEVVERPSSVVKELVENAIDAKATAITVEIKGGGIDLIRITDNGSGIEKEDIRSAFLRHSTSKISQIEDLQEVMSLGFRGEALASIGAVSLVELLTKTVDAAAGIRYVVDGGKEIEFSEVGCPEGTTLIINQLFYNTPVRKKFLKAASTEGSYVTELLNKIALGHPEISFKLIVNGKVKLHTSGNFKLKDVIFAVYGKETVSKMIPIDYKGDHISITGFLGKPELSRANRNFENYFINGRYIKSKVLMKAIEDAFAPKLILHRFPFTVLHITMNSSHVDVNVHPTKMDVRFDDEKGIYQEVFSAVNQVLNHTDLIPEVTFYKEEKEKVVFSKEAPEPFEKNRRNKNNEEETGFISSISDRKATAELSASSKHAIEDLREMRNEAVKIQQTEQQDNKIQGLAKEMAAKYGSTKEPSNPTRNEQSTPDISVNRQYEPDQKHDIIGEQATLSEHFIDEKTTKKHKIIGQLFTTYWIVELSDKYYIIDQHAAHERVLYEGITKQMENHTIHSQGLLEPMVIHVLPLEMERFLSFQSLFAQMGFEAEPFGDDAIMIRAVPYIFNRQLLKEDFKTILDQLDDRYDESKADILLDDMASKACKAAVKAHDKMTELECHQLIDSLLELENPFNCPHGRPTIISMTRYELEKKFKRIV